MASASAPANEGKQHSNPPKEETQNQPSGSNVVASIVVRMEVDTCEPTWPEHA
ncbi:hypothetical protein KGM_200900 [Danaus plexippus plexippus]|uniref:Uncharacterized protein n=1 Tax=Danaus plexippus plexippus TaxID=278856 RepID=A0A212ETF6_DANPL|nr:hypothetical protein KGM_200900 [Danaus plexippus plexippus]